MNNEVPSYAWGCFRVTTLWPRVSSTAEVLEALAVLEGLGELQPGRATGCSDKRDILYWRTGDEERVWSAGTLLYAGRVDSRIFIGSSRLNEVLFEQQTVYGMNERDSAWNKCTGKCTHTRTRMLRVWNVVSRRVYVRVTCTFNNMLKFK